MVVTMESSFVNKSIRDLDRIIDEEDGHVNIDFAVVSDYPICHWASKFVCDDQIYNIIDHNSLVLCTLSEESIDLVMKERKKIIENIINDEDSVNDEDRIITFHEKGVMYGLICEFGIDYGITNLNKHMKTCNYILSSDCPNSFYIQFPRYKGIPITSEKYSLMSKEKFVNNLVLSSDKLYNSFIRKLMELGVSPNNIGLIDCGEL